MFKKIARKTLVVFLTVLVFFFSNITPMLKQVALADPVGVGTNLLDSNSLSLDTEDSAVDEEPIAAEKCQGCFGNMPKPLSF
jgi:hypothetical protein